MTEREIHQYIEMNPIRGTDPVFRGTVIAVKHVIDDFAKGMSAEEILSEHNELNKKHLQACFVFVKIQLEEHEQLRVYAITGIPPFVSFWRLLFPKK